jgi:hypothetical protein
MAPSGACAPSSARAAAAIGASIGSKAGLEHERPGELALRGGSIGAGAAAPASLS